MMSEALLVKDFIKSLNKKSAPFNFTRTATEYYYKTGAVDVIADTGDQELYAFEAKLIKWKDALHQAYRSSSFAHFSYVVLPENSASNALKARHEFERRGVGLCCVSGSKTTIAIEAIKNKPFMPWLTDGALEKLDNT